MRFSVFSPISLINPSEFRVSAHYPKVLFSGLFSLTFSLDFYSESEISAGSRLRYFSNRPFLLSLDDPKNVPCLLNGEECDVMVDLQVREMVVMIDQDLPSGNQNVQIGGLNINDRLETYVQPITVELLTPEGTLLSRGSHSFPLLYEKLGDYPYTMVIYSLYFSDV